jgi:hypothetical protein
MEAANTVAASAGWLLACDQWSSLFPHSLFSALEKYLPYLSSGMINRNVKIRTRILAYDFLFSQMESKKSGENAPSIAAQENANRCAFGKQSLESIHAFFYFRFQRWG